MTLPSWEQMTSTQRRMLRWTRIGDDCWEWLGARSGGYGVLSDGARPHKRVLRAHRVSYELFHGPITDDLFVCHRCDNRACVNPAHLCLGTVRDNYLDAIERGRLARGERHHNARLTEAMVRTARKQPRSVTDQEIAGWFGVSRRAIGDARRGASWRHVKDSELDLEGP